MANEVVLLDFLLSGFGMRCRIALAEKGVRYEYREEDLTNKSKLLLKMNPVREMIPVLIHNGRPICESAVIVQYIDEVWKGSAPLLPLDPYRRALAKFWADFIDRKIYSSGNGIWTTKVEGEQEASKKEFIDSLKILEQQALGDHLYLGGENFGFLDVIFIPYYPWFHVYEAYGNFKIEESCPTLIAWAKRCLEKETVSKSLPRQDKVSAYAAEVRKRLGIE